MRPLGNLFMHTMFSLLDRQIVALGTKDSGASILPYTLAHLTDVSCQFSVLTVDFMDGRNACYRWQYDSIFFLFRKFFFLPVSRQVLLDECSFVSRLLCA